jgi:RNA polymerase sigma factor (sigma-70 family)
LQICFWRVVKNLAKNYRKKQVRVSQLFPSLDSDPTTVNLVMELPSNAIGLEDQIYLQEFLDDLSPREREAFVLRYAGDASIKDICNTLGRGTTTVKTVLNRAKKQLAKAA